MKGIQKERLIVLALWTAFLMLSLIILFGLVDVVTKEKEIYSFIVECLWLGFMLSLWALIALNIFKSLFQSR